MKNRKTMKENIIPTLFAGSLFIVVYILALFLTKPFEEVGLQTFENPSDPFNIAYILLILFSFTIAILLIARFWKKKLIQIILVGAIGYTAAYVFYPLLIIFLPMSLSLLLSISIALLMIIALLRHPEWYVLDICGVIIGAGAAAIFGISLSVTLVIALLIILALYDAVSVYQTKHMVDLADTVLDLKLPVLLVIPKKTSYSLLKENMGLKEKLEKQVKKDAFFIGLGDIVMPGILIVSIYHNIKNAMPLLISSIAGILVGFIVLMFFVLKGKPQAGLPILCGGAILGYMFSSVLLYGKLIGLTF